MWSRTTNESQLRRLEPSTVALQPRERALREGGKELAWWSIRSGPSDLGQGVSPSLQTRLVSTGIRSDVCVPSWNPHAECDNTSVTSIRSPRCVKKLEHHLIHSVFRTDAIVQHVPEMTAKSQVNAAFHAREDHQSLEIMLNIRPEPHIGPAI